MRKARQLGRYQVTDRIAFGGMAELFRGFTFGDDGFRRDVAIKKVLPHFTEDKQFIQMLTDEFRLVSYLRHPNIAEVYELAAVDDSLLIAMEYVDGKDLRTVVEKARLSGESLGADDAAYILANALDGLNRAHEATDHDGQPLNIVHRDFSPSNILVGYDGHVKICDFGVAKAAHNKVQTKTGIIKGKVKYMSPEQAYGRKLDRRSDLFSAGTVLYEIIVGAAPFNAPNEVDLIFQVRDASPRPIRDATPEVPEELAAIVEKSMARSRSARYQTALEFRDDLLAFLKRHHPTHRRTKLARVMKRLFAEEIERELRALEEYVIDVTAPVDYGTNLIADALGPDAAFNHFHANPSRTTTSAADEEADRSSSALHAARTKLIPDPPAKKRKGTRVPVEAPPAPVEEDLMLDEKTAVSPRRRH